MLLFQEDILCSINHKTFPLLFGVICIPHLILSNGLAQHLNPMQQCRSPARCLGDHPKNMIQPTDFLLEREAVTRLALFCPAEIVSRGVICQ